MTARPPSAAHCPWAARPVRGGRGRRLLAAASALALLLALLPPAIARAAGADEGTVPDDTSPPSEASAASSDPGNPDTSPTPLTDPLPGPLDTVTAGGYCLLDAATGQVLASRMPDTPFYPASLTKMMTLALVLEQFGPPGGSGQPDEADPSGETLSAAVTVSESAVAAVGPGSSSIYLRAGETMTLEDAVLAAQLASANDAANVLAEAAAGSIEGFVARMNEQAAALGLQSTRFANPSGYHDEAQYTTPRELARIAAWALTIPGFAELLGCPEHTMPGNAVHPAARRFTNDNRLLAEEPYPGCLGGKTGWTGEAHFTMMQAASREGRTLIAVVLACPSRAASYADCVALLDHGFADFTPIPLDEAKLGLPSLPVIREGQTLGEVPLILTGTGPAELLLPAGASEAELSFTYLGPPAYTVDAPFAGRIAVRGETGQTLAELPLAPEPAALAALTGAEPEQPWDRRGLRSILLLALAVLLGAVVSSRDASQLAAQRRRAARRRLDRQLARGHARIERLEASEEEADPPADRRGPAGPAKPPSGP